MLSGGAVDAVGEGSAGVDGDGEVRESLEPTYQANVAETSAVLLRVRSARSLKRWPREPRGSRDTGVFPSTRISLLIHRVTALFSE